MGKIEQLRAILGDDCVDLMLSTYAQAGPRALSDAKLVNITARRDAVERTYEADWVKYLMRVIEQEMRMH